MPDATPTTDTTSADTASTTTDASAGTKPSPGTKATLQADLDAARVRLAALESELGTVTADRDGAVAQLADAGREVAALRERLDATQARHSPDRAIDLFEQLARSTEASACLAAASVAQHEGRNDQARELRDRAFRCLG